MKRLLIAAAAAAALVTGLVLGLHSMCNLDPILEANVEALTRNEDNPSPGCTGPKKENLHGNIFCHSENTAPCMDMYGCN